MIRGHDGRVAMTGPALGSRERSQMDVLDHLTMEHRKVEQMIGQLEDASSAEERQPILAELGEALTMHMNVEEERVYPIVEARLGEYMAASARTEHDTARDDLVKLADLADDDGFAPALAAFKGDIAKHVHEEEHAMFPQLRTTAASEIAALGDAHKLEREVQDELVVDT